MQTLLIVDDQTDNLFTMTQVVETLVPDCRVVTASSAERGFTLVLEEDPCAALIDVQMPGMDGIEMCSRLKADPKSRHIPVILITSHRASASLKARGLEAGADDFISRPIDNEELAARVKVGLRIKKAEDRWRSLNARLEILVEERTAELAFANQKLRAERDRSQNLIDIAPVIILELDDQGRIVTFNPYLEGLSGFSLEEVRGKPWIETFVPEAEQTRISSVFRATISGDPTSGNVNPILTRDGNEREIHWFNRTLENGGGQLTGVLSIGQDITGLKRASQIQEVLYGILREAAEEYDLTLLISKVRDEMGEVIDTTNFFVALYDPVEETYHFPYFASSEEQINSDQRLSLPTSLTDYVRRTGKALWVDQTVREELERRGEVKSVGEPSLLWLGAPLETSDGVMGVVCVQSYSDPFLYSEEDLTLLHHVAGTISIAICRIKAEEQMTRLGRVVEDSVNEVYVFDVDGWHFTQANRTARDNLGLSMAELRQMTPVDLRPEFSDELFAQALEPLVRREKERLHFTTFHRRKDGSLYPVEMFLSQVSTGGNPVFVAIALDITERRKIEAELEGHRQYLEDLVEERTLQLTRATEVAEAVNEILYEALTCEDEAGLSQMCLGVACRLTGAEFGFIGKMNEAGRMDTVALDQPAWDRCRIPGAQATVMIRDMDIRGLWGKVLSSKQTQIFNDPAESEFSVGVPEGHPVLSSFLGVPLMLRGQTMGLIGVANKEMGFSESDAEALKALAAAFVQALMRLRAEREAARRNRERQKALNLMVGRELRMVELKKETRTLEEENRSLRERLARVTNSES